MGCVEVVVVCSKTALMHTLQKIDDELTFFGCGVFDFAFVARLVYWIEMFAYFASVLFIAFFAIAIVYTVWT